MDPIVTLPLDPRQDPRPTSWRRIAADVALGRAPADLVVRGGRVINVHCAEALDADVAVVGDRVSAVGELPQAAIGPDTIVVEASGAFVAPGFIEPHMHAGEPSLAPADLAVALLERGTTTLATDLVEFYAAGGVEAVRWALDELAGQGLRVLFLLPLHLLGAEALGTVRHRADEDELIEMASWPEVAGVNEPPPDAVLRCDGQVLRVLDATLHGTRVFEGHGPLLDGARLQAYVATGASSDHESTSADEALAKLRLGSRVIMRDCSAARDLRELAPLVAARPELARFFMVCSDDLQLKELVREGHIDHKLRAAIDCGVDPITAIQLATINVAEYFGMANELGAITPGSFADLLVLDSLEGMRPHTVIAQGRLVRRLGQTTASIRRSPPPRSLIATVLIPAPVSAADLVHEGPPGAGDSVTVRVIAIDNGTLISQARTHELAVADGRIVPDLGSDVLKAVAFDRHTASGRRTVAYVHGTGLQAGALATTFTAPHYGLLVIGTSDAEIAAAVNALATLGGGLVAVDQEAVIAAVPFEVGAVMTQLPIDETIGLLDGFEAAAAKLGCRLTDPVTALASLTIPQIPHYGLSDLGLIDTLTQRFVDVVVDPRQDDARNAAVAASSTTSSVPSVSSTTP
jgi:adenine deaminase